MGRAAICATILVAAVAAAANAAAEPEVGLDVPAWAPPQPRHERLKRGLFAPFFAGLRLGDLFNGAVRNQFMASPEAREHIRRFYMRQAAKKLAAASNTTEEEGGDKRERRDAPDDARRALIRRGPPTVLPLLGLLTTSFDSTARPRSLKTEAGARQRRSPGKKRGGFRPVKVGKRPKRPFWSRVRGAFSGLGRLIGRRPASYDDEFDEIEELM